MATTLPFFRFVRIPQSTESNQMRHQPQPHLEVYSCSGQCNDSLRLGSEADVLMKVALTDDGCKQLLPKFSGFMVRGDHRFPKSLRLASSARGR